MHRMQILVLVLSLVHHLKAQQNEHRTEDAKDNKNDKTIRSFNRLYDWKIYLRNNNVQNNLETNKSHELDKPLVGQSPIASDNAFTNIYKKPDDNRIEEKNILYDKPLCEYLKAKLLRLILSGSTNSQSGGIVNSEDYRLLTGLLEKCNVGPTVGSTVGVGRSRTKLSHGYVNDIPNTNKYSVEKNNLLSDHFDERPKETNHLGYKENHNDVLEDDTEEFAFKDKYGYLLLLLLNTPKPDLYEIRGVVHFLRKNNVPLHPNLVFLLKSRLEELENDENCSQDIEWIRLIFEIKELLKVSKLSDIVTPEIHTQSTNVPEINNYNKFSPKNKHGYLLLLLLNSPSPDKNEVREVLHILQQDDGTLDRNLVFLLQTRLEELNSDVKYFGDVEWVRIIFGIMQFLKLSVTSNVLYEVTPEVSTQSTTMPEFENQVTPQIYTKSTTVTEINNHNKSSLKNKHGYLLLLLLREPRPDKDEVKEVLQILQQDDGQLDRILVSLLQIRLEELQNDLKYSSDVDWIRLINEIEKLLEVSKASEIINKVTPGIHTEIDNNNESFPKNKHGYLLLLLLRAPKPDKDEVKEVLRILQQDDGQLDRILVLLLQTRLEELQNDLKYSSDVDWIRLINEIEELLKASKTSEIIYEVTPEIHTQYTTVPEIYNDNEISPKNKLGYLLFLVLKVPRPDKDQVKEVLQILQQNDGQLHQNLMSLLQTRLEELQNDQIYSSDVDWTHLINGIKKFLDESGSSVIIKEVTPEHDGQSTTVYTTNDSSRQNEYVYILLALLNAQRPDKSNVEEVINVLLKYKFQMRPNLADQLKIYIKKLEDSPYHTNKVDWIHIINKLKELLKVSGPSETIDGVTPKVSAASTSVPEFDNYNELSPKNKHGYLLFLVLKVQRPNKDQVKEFLQVLKQDDGQLDRNLVSLLQIRLDELQNDLKYSSDVDWIRLINEIEELLKVSKTSEIINKVTPEFHTQSTAVPQIDNYNKSSLKNKNGYLLLLLLRALRPDKDEVKEVLQILQQDDGQLDRNLVLQLQIRLEELRNNLKYSSDVDWIRLINEIEKLLEVSKTSEIVSKVTPEIHTEIDNNNESFPKNKHGYLLLLLLRAPRPDKDEVKKVLQILQQDDGQLDRNLELQLQIRLEELQNDLKYSSDVDWIRLINKIEELLKVSKTSEINNKVTPEFHTQSTAVPEIDNYNKSSPKNKHGYILLLLLRAPRPEKDVVKEVLQILKQDDGQLDRNLVSLLQIRLEELQNDLKYSSDVDWIRLINEIEKLLELSKASEIINKVTPEIHTEIDNNNESSSKNKHGYLLLLLLRAPRPDKDVVKEVLQILQQDDGQLDRNLLLLLQIRLQELQNDLKYSSDVDWIVLINKIEELLKVSKTSEKIYEVTPEIHTQSTTVPEIYNENEISPKNKLGYLLFLVLKVPRPDKDLVKEVLQILQQNDGQLHQNLMSLLQTRLEELQNDQIYSSDVDWTHLINKIKKFLDESGSSVIIKEVTPEHNGQSTTVYTTNDSSRQNEYVYILLALLNAQRPDKSDVEEVINVLLKDKFQLRPNLADQLKNYIKKLEDSPYHTNNVEWIHIINKLKELLKASGPSETIDGVTPNVSAASTSVPEFDNYNELSPKNKHGSLLLLLLKATTPDKDKVKEILHILQQHDGQMHQNLLLLLQTRLEELEKDLKYSSDVEWKRIIFEIKELLNVSGPIDITGGVTNTPEFDISSVFPPENINTYLSFRLESLLNALRPQKDEVKKIINIFLKDHVQLQPNFIFLLSRWIKKLEENTYFTKDVDWNPILNDLKLLLNSVENNKNVFETDSSTVPKYIGSKVRYLLFLLNANVPNKRVILNLIDDLEKENVENVEIHPYLLFLLKTNLTLILRDSSYIRDQDWQIIALKLRQLINSLDKSKNNETANVARRNSSQVNHIISWLYNHAD